MNIDDFSTLTHVYAKERYLEYAIATIQDRAIPYLHDGLKPVHRRILFAMTVMGIKAKEKPKKSARIVGDVIGKYHPHGDTSVYDAMVRLSQPWVMRYPLIDGQGNFGSRDGDGAAAMRYTEARLTEFAEHILLSEMKEGTVDYRDNYDGTMTEVELLPSRLNNLLLNGSEGIAVALATKIPSHNIRNLTDATIAYIDNNNISIPEIMEHLKAPDFASGGQIITPKDKIIEAYEKGQGKIKVRARWEIEKMPRGLWQIVITELPPDLSIKDVLLKVNKITNPPIVKDKKGKPKPLSQQVLQERQFLNNILAKAKDDSSEEAGFRLIFEPKSSRQDPDEFMNSLIPLLGLETNYNMNMVVIDLDLKPQLKNIKELIADWVAYRLYVIKRKLNYHLEKTNNRIHILEGRLKIYADIDKAIQIIREEDNPKDELIRYFDITEAQAEDILEIKLRQLAKLEKDKLEKELEKLLKEKERLELLLSSEKRLNSLMKKDIEADTVKFEDERRSLIQESEEITNKKTDTLIDEDITVIFSKDGWLTQRKGHEYDLNNLGFKDGDSLHTLLESRSSKDILFLASNGRGYSIKSNEIPSGKNFIHVNSLIDSKGAKIINVFKESDDKYIFTNSSGYGFISRVSNLLSKNKAGKHFMTIDDEFEVFKALPFNDEFPRINVLTTDDRLLNFETNLLKELDKGKGVQLVRLVGKATVKEVSLSDNDELTIFVNDKKEIIKDVNYDEFKSSRGLRGKKVKPNTRLN